MSTVLRTSAARSRELGRRNGYSQGHAHGYHLGVCHSIMKRTPIPESPVFNIHVAYVQEGLFSLNEGIMSALEGLVRRLSIYSPHEDVAARIQDDEDRPDVVLVLNGLHAFPIAGVDAIRALGIPIAVWFADDPYFSDRTASIAPHYDVVYTHELSCIPLYESNGARRVRYLPLAASPEIFKPRAVPPKYRCDILFVGTAFDNRIAFFDSIIEQFRPYKFLFVGGLWNRLRAYPDIAHHCILEGATPEETANYYSGARIVINLHRPHDHSVHNQNSLGLPGLSINPRTYEVNASGTLQLTDIRDDLPRYYAPGLEIETYSSANELVHKIRHYLHHEGERQAIAARALKRTLLEHTYRHRLIGLLNDLLYGS